MVLTIWTILCMSHTQTHVPHPPNSMPILKKGYPQAQVWLKYPTCLKPHERRTCNMWASSKTYCQVGGHDSARSSILRMAHRFCRCLHNSWKIHDRSLLKFYSQCTFWRLLILCQLSQMLCPSCQASRCRTCCAPHAKWVTCRRLPSVRPSVNLGSIETRSPTLQAGTDPTSKTPELLSLEMKSFTPRFPFEAMAAMPSAI